MRLADIVVGRRHRRDMGDLDGLAASIASLGLLQPIAVTTDGKLVAGGRRLAAVKQLSWEEIPVHVVTGLDDAVRHLRAERDENICRAPLTLSESIALGRKLETLLATEAKQRQRRAGIANLPNASCGNLPPLGDTEGNKGKTRDKVGAAVGLGARTYVKARAVVEAAAEDPETFGDLVGFMDRKGKADPAYKEMRRRQYLREREQERPAVVGGMGLLTGDFRKVGRKVPDASVDLIFTDAPYSDDAVPLYGELAKFAARVLRPGGLCLAYTGVRSMHKAHDEMAQHLDYFWTFSVFHSDDAGMMWVTKLRNKWKPILAFVRPPVKPWWEYFGDAVIGGGSEKQDHRWQQAVSEAAYFVERLCPAGGLVCDPMCGSGTTLVAAVQSRRRYVGIEIDAATATQARARVAEAVGSGTTTEEAQDRKRPANRRRQVRPRRTTQ